MTSAACGIDLNARFANDTQRRTGRKHRNEQQAIDGSYRRRLCQRQRRVLGSSGSRGQRRTEIQQRRSLEEQESCQPWRWRKFSANVRQSRSLEEQESCQPRCWRKFSANLSESWYPLIASLAKRVGPGSNVGAFVSITFTPAARQPFPSFPLSACNRRPS